MTGRRPPSSGLRSGHCPSPMSEPALARRPRQLRVDDEVWGRLDSIAASGRFSAELSSAFANGRAMLEAPDGLRDRTPLTIEWTGGRRPTGRRGGAHRPPHRPRLSDQLQVRVRHRGQRLSRPALRRPAGHLGHVGARRTGTRWSPPRSWPRSTGPAWPQPDSPASRRSPRSAPRAVGQAAGRPGRAHLPRQHVAFAPTPICAAPSARPRPHGGPGSSNLRGIASGDHAVATAPDRQCPLFRPRQ